MNNQPSSHQKKTDFFARNLQKGLSNNINFKEEMKDKNTNQINQLVLKCCGYGFFQKNKKSLKQRFVNYVQDSVQFYEKIQSIKIIYNGFQNQSQSGDDRQIKNQINICRDPNKLSQLRSLSIQSTNLRQCPIQDLKRVFNLISMAGIRQQFHQLNIQLADWQFRENYPNTFVFSNILKQFLDDSADTFNFKKFRLQISSWYMKESQALNFLSGMLHLVAIQQIYQNICKQLRISSKKDLQKFLQNFFNNFTYPNQHERVNKIILDFIIQHYFIKRIDLKKLKNVQKQQITKHLYIFLTLVDFKTKNQKPKRPKKGAQNYPFQLQKYQKQLVIYEEKIKQFEKSQNYINENLIKYPTQCLHQLRVEQFHKKMAYFIKTLLEKMNNIQQYQIDLRNWHSKFNMSQLKKILDTSVNANKQQFSIIRKAFSVLGQGKRQSQQEPVVKINYIM